jgi:hypothetical protein
MGGILGHDAWRRSNGGLWLPRLFGDVEYGWCCCEEEGGCGTYGPLLYEETATVLVSISGIVDDAADCVWANGDYEPTYASTLNYGTYCRVLYDLNFNRNIPCYGFFLCLIQVIFHIDQTGSTLGFTGRRLQVNMIPHRCTYGWMAANDESGELAPFDNSAENSWSTWNNITDLSGNCDLSGMSVTVEIP